MHGQQLMRPGGPWLYVLAAPPAEAEDVLAALRRAAPGRLAVRVLRGGKAKSVPALFDECAAALQFPLYFGANWDAFLDCLTDPAVLPDEGLVLFVADATHLLESAPAKEAQRFLAVLGEAVQARAKRPLRVILQVAPADEAALRKRWEAAGATLARLA
jgi:hypothetical protein